MHAHTRTHRACYICKQSYLHIHCINFIFYSTVSPPLGDVLNAVLSLYMKNPTLPLPSSAEICICTSTTTAEEVTF